MSEKFLYEAHMHTSESSACSRIKGADAADFYKAIGYTGIIITDHFFNGNCAVPRDLPWEERVELFMRGYENAKKRGDEIGLDVFFGWEYCHGGSEILTYGLDKEWLLSNPDVCSWSVNEYCKRAHEAGAFLSQAHPFREAPWVPFLRLFPRLTDAAEVYNCTVNKTPKDSELSNFYASHYELHRTAGSDFHAMPNSRFAANAFCRKLTSVDDYGKYVCADENEIIEDALEYLGTADCEAVKRLRQG